MTNGCPNPEEIGRWLQAELELGTTLTLEERRYIGSHVPSCEDCKPVALNQLCDLREERTLAD
ncbi:hypothetical protein HY374_01735 [Candidatus Berkelbacteria bacterium]|nr:hypothetical protein [Candidatus Berkelbacteria bacterium]